MNETFSLNSDFDSIHIIYIIILYNYNSSYYIEIIAIQNFVAGCMYSGTSSNTPNSGHLPYNNIYGITDNS